MADVQIAVRLRRKASADLGVFAGRQIVVDDLANEIGGGGNVRAAHLVRPCFSGWSE